LLPLMAAGFTLHKGIIRDATGREVAAVVANEAAIELARQAGVL